MKPALVAGCFGLAAGLIGGALIAKSKKSEPDRPVTVAPAPTPPPAPVSPPSPEEDPRDAEVERLKAQVADLQSKLSAAKESAVKAPAPPPSSTEGSKPEWMEKLDSLLKKGGLTAYKGAEFMAMVEELKKQGKEGIDVLAERLLNGESAGERFLAAALLEDLDDASAIPALAKSLSQDDDLLVRRMSSHAIALIKEEAGLPSLRSAMSSDADWGVRVNAAYGVAKLGQPDGVKTLEDAYKAPTTPAEYRLAVLGGLADVAAPSSAPIFRKVLAESTDITYLYLAIGAVQTLKDPSFIPDLNRIVGDAKYSANVREMAKKAIEALAK